MNIFKKSEHFCLLCFSASSLFMCECEGMRGSVCMHPCILKHSFLYVTPQLMAAGESGASGRRVVRTARGSAAESARLRSPNTEDGCVTGWHWRLKTARAACAHRVGNTTTTSLHWFTMRKRTV